MRSGNRKGAIESQLWGLDLPIEEDDIRVTLGDDTLIA